MHEPVKSQLENLLRGRVDAEAATAVEAHLFACSECSGELEKLRLQSAAIRTLRAPASLCPAAGFYGRVMQRIETTKPSFWSLLLDPRFGQRLVYATASLALLMAALLLATTPETPELAQTPVQILAVQPDAPKTAAAPEQQQQQPTEDVQQGRERFLVTLASFSD